MRNLNEYIPTIIDQLKNIDINKIVLFGSLATDSYDNGSDIDLLVILDSDNISQNFDEKMRNKLLVRRAIYEISKEIPIDLLVYTKKEFEIIEQNKTSFFNDITSNGKVLYEKAS